VAKGLKNKLVDLYPELKSLNERDSSVIKLTEALDREVRRQFSKGMLDKWSDLAVASLGAAGGVLAGTHGVGGPYEGAAIGSSSLLFLKRILQSPEVKSRLAFAMNKGSMVAGKQAGKLLGYGIAKMNEEDQ